jgi:hypothetical protein
MSHRYPTRYLIAALALALVAGACSGDSDATLTAGGAGSRESVTVEPDFSMAPLPINIKLTDEGFDPEIIFIPAGRRIRLILRNHGTTEHHFRINGLIPAQMRWMLFPEIDEYEVASMTNEELIDYGIAGVTDIGELTHLVHHLKPSFVPFKDVSPAGVKPLGTDVHGYVTLGRTEVMTFIALQTGEYAARDVLFPEITGRVIVFEVPDEAS